jgi:plasmid stabilization system protein ParE
LIDSSFTPCPQNYSDTHYREVIVSPYRFFYRVKKNVVWIVAVWHGAQLPDSPAEDAED